jgi:NAD(P)H-dependent FMN reductase
MKAQPSVIVGSNRKESINQKSASALAKADGHTLDVRSTGMDLQRAGK